MRTKRLIVLPSWVNYALFYLGLAALLTGWYASVLWWAIYVGLAVVFGLWSGRRLVRVRLEPSSKERGVITWTYYRAQPPKERPRVVWDGEEEAVAPQLSPPA
jgi:hypothetical protein